MSTVPSMAPTPEEPAKIGAFGRLIGVLMSPGETFADIARVPTWIAPILVLTVLSLCASFVLMQRVDWRSYLEKQLSQSSRWEQLTPEQKTQQLELTQKIIPYQAYGGGLLGPVVGALIIGAIFWGCFNLFLSAGIKFKLAYCISAHALMVSLVSTPLVILVSFLKKPGEVNPEHLLASNVGELLSTETPKWLLSLAGSLDVFSFWLMALLAIGFAAANPKKISKGAGFAVVFGVWAVYVLIKVGWVLIFS